MPNEELDNTGETWISAGRKYKLDANGHIKREDGHNNWEYTHKDAPDIETAKSIFPEG